MKEKGLAEKEALVVKDSRLVVAVCATAAWYLAEWYTWPEANVKKWG